LRIEQENQIKPSVNEDVGQNEILGGSSKILVFSIKGRDLQKRTDYGVSIEQIQEIGTLEDVTRVPGAPGHVLGVMNLRGKIITIVDTGKLLGISQNAGEQATSAEKKNTRDNGHIIVSKIRNCIIGLLVDEVNQVIGISHKDFEIVPPMLKESSPYIKGITRLNDDLCVLLDVKLLLENENPADVSAKVSMMNDLVENCGPRNSNNLEGEKR
jgi:purine-binding chemotaxis protein CheW